MPSDEEDELERREQQAHSERIEKAVGMSTAYKSKLESLRQSRPGIKHLKKMRDEQEAKELASSGKLF